MIKLFELGDDYAVKLDKEWISTIPEFRDILRRDRGSKGDTQGRAKLQAQKEFTYIYHLLDFRSPYENFPLEERKANALKDSELTEHPNDPEIRAAIAKYQLLLENSSPSLRMLRAVKVSLLPLENYFLNFNPEETDDIKNHIANIKNLPGMQKSLQEYEEQVKAEAQEDGAIRGQAEKGFREDPD